MAKKALTISDASQEYSTASNILSILERDLPTMGQTKNQAVNASPDSIQPLLTFPQVVAFLRVSRPTVYSLMYREGLPFIKLGKSIRFSPVSVQRWLLQYEKSGYGV